GEELHRAIAELTSDFAVIVRLEPEGGAVLESATDGFRRVTGYMAEEFNGPFEWRRLLDLDTLTDGAKMGERLLNGERVSLELRIVGKDGARRWLRCHAEPFQHSTNDRVDCILVSAEDVTDRRMADESLRRPRSRAGDQPRRFARRHGRGRAPPGRRGGAGRSRRPCAASGGSASLAGRARPPRRLI